MLDFPNEAGPFRVVAEVEHQFRLSVQGRQIRALTASGICSPSFSPLSTAKFDCQFCSTLDNMNQFFESEWIQAICLPASGPTDWSKTASTVMATT